MLQSKEMKTRQDLMWPCNLTADHLDERISEKKTYDIQLAPSERKNKGTEDVTAFSVFGVTAQSK